MKTLLIALLLIALITSCVNSSMEAESKTDDPEVNVLKNLKPLITPADTASAGPYLFTGKNGLVYLSWIEKKETGSFLKFSTLKNDQWSAPRVMCYGNNWFINWADYPMIAAVGENNLVAHFLEKSATGKFTYDIKLVTSADGGKTWSAPKLLHDDGKKAEHGFVSMVPYEEGYFISWLDGRNSVMEEGKGHEGHYGQMTLRGAIVNKEGNKTSEWEIDERVCDCCQTSAAITENGPVVVYRDRSANETRDISIVRLVNDQWTSPKPVFPDNWKINGCPVNGPRISAIGNHVAVAWFTSPDKNAQVNIVFSTDGGNTFNAPVRIDEGNAVGRVDVEMLDHTTAMVTWMEGPLIKAVKVHKGGKKDTSIVIASTSEARASGFPQMTRSGDHIIFAWTNEKEKTIQVAKYISHEVH